MSKTEPPPNVYQLAQSNFDAIPDSPWVYWVKPSLRHLFEFLPRLGDMAPSIHGTATYDNFRFLRFWWEAGIPQISRGSRSWAEFELSKKTHVPYMKGGPFLRWYGNQEFVLQLQNRGRVLIAFLDSKRDSIRGSEQIFREGITYSFLTSGTFSARISPGGFIFDVAGSSLFPQDIPLLLSVLNSKFAAYVLKLLNPTVNFQVGDLARLPIPVSHGVALQSLVGQAVIIAKLNTAKDETSYDFIAPSPWRVGLGDMTAAQARLAELEREIDDEVYRLYAISDEDRAAIEAELAGEPITDEDNAEYATENTDEEGPEPPMTIEELADRWISYAVGIVLGRFQPGDLGSLGSAVYRREDFIVGSLSAPNDDEFDNLVGQSDRFSYIDKGGGRHMFSSETEAALKELAVPDGISVLDQEHARDLPNLVERALTLMLGSEETQEVIEAGAGGDLRKFIQRKFFTQHHIKLYRKRAVYWSIQSRDLSYGFVLFHEKIHKDTFYVLQRDYLDIKRNRIALRLEEIQNRLESAQGREGKRIETEMAEQQELAEELGQFAKDLEDITQNGYEPRPNWIDDGVILRMAPLWKVIPVWQKEPKKYWDRLASGDYDWSHIAMHYWPERAREKCKTNKSYAIAHGLEELYEGQ